MKNKKGFTLIELLAVIVILAIIALVAVPIVLNMIGNARKKAAESSAYGFIDAIEYNNGFAQTEQAGYTEINGTDLDATTINVKMKGTKPTSGKVTIVDGKVISATGLCFNNYEVNYDGRKATVGKGCNGSSSSEETTPQPVPFATDNWSTIAANTTLDKYKVGDEKTINMDVDGDGTKEEYHIMIVNKTACTNETSESACGMVLQFKELLNITNDDNKKMNSTDTNFGGWPAMSLRTYLNTTIYNKLKAEIGDIIIDTKTVSEYGSATFEPNFTSTNDKLYLLSTKEVGIDVGFDEPETRKLDYYDEGTGADANAKRIKYNYGTETAYHWWLRTAALSNSYYFYAVSTSGGSDYKSASDDSGVAPAFRIGS